MPFYYVQKWSFIYLNNIVRVRIYNMKDSCRFWGKVYLAGSSIKHQLNVINQYTSIYIVSLFFHRIYYNSIEKWLICVSLLWVYSSSTDCLVVDALNLLISCNPTFTIPRPCSLFLYLSLHSHWILWHEHPAL